MKTSIQRNHLKLILSLLVLCVLALPAHRASAQAKNPKRPQYEITRLEDHSIGVPILAVAGMNNRGQLIGSSGDGHFLWDKGVYTEIKAVGRQIQYPLVGLNDRGLVIGHWKFPDGRSSSFLWENGVFTELSRNTNETFRAQAINRRGDVLGDLDGNPALWRHAAITRLSALPGSEAWALNDRGQVVGRQWIDGDYRPTLWHKGKAIQLGSLEGGGGTATAINNRGQIVGMSKMSSGNYNAFLWHKGVMIDLGTLPGHLMWPKIINERGQVMGEWGGERTFFWEKGVIADIGTFGGETYSGSMNDRGQIVGYSNGPGGEHGFLWENGVMTRLGDPTNGLPFNFIPHVINNRGQIAGSYYDESFMLNTVLLTPTRRKH